MNEARQCTKIDEVVHDNQVTFLLLLLKKQFSLCIDITDLRPYQL
jgi:hypothetical protein